MGDVLSAARGAATTLANHAHNCTERRLSTKQATELESVILVALEQLRGERDAALRERASLWCITPEDRESQLAEWDKLWKRAVAAEAAVRAGGNAADALRPLFAELDDYSIRLTDERLDDLHSAIISAAREALAVLEPAAGSLHTEATQQEGSGERI